MEDKNNKKFILLGIILIIICIGITLKITYDSRDSYLVINNKVLTYNNKKWYNIDNESKVFDKYDFNVYNEKTFQGKYEMKFFNSIWYFFDKNNDSHKFSGDVLAYAGKRKIKILDFEIKDIDENDLSIINDVLKENDIEIYDLSDLTTHQKIEYDFNEDGNDEIIYNLNNINGNKINNKYFTTIIYNSVSENKEVLYYDTSSEEKDDLYNYDLYYLFSMDNINRIVIAAAKDLDISSTTYLIYSFKNDKIVEEKGIDDEKIDVNVDDSGKIGSSIAIIVLSIAILGGIIYLIIKRSQKEKNKL